MNAEKVLKHIELILNDNEKYPQAHNNITKIKTIIEDKEQYE